MEQAAIEPADLPADPGASYDRLRSSLGAPTDSSAATMPVAADSRNRALALLGGSGSEESRLVLRSVIGRGGYGEVWDAEQLSLGRTVAVKTIRRDLRLMRTDAEHARQLEALFRAEAATTAQLDHPNIVPIYDMAADADGRPMLAMKLVRGRTWSAQLKEELAALAPAELLLRHVPILADVAQAVAFAHSRGIIHRDLKPAQVMIGEFGEVLVMDWGLAMAFGSPPRGGSPREAEVRQSLPSAETASNPSGTPAYMAPEQTEAHTRRLGPWTDVYLLGAILFELLTGTTPHVGPTSTDAFRQAAAGDIEPPSRRAPGRHIPEELERLCLRAMNRDPETRPDAAGFVSGLRDFLTGATRRAEAERLVAEASIFAARRDAHLRAGKPMPGGYPLYSDAGAKLAKARALAPDLEAIPQLEKSVHEMFGWDALWRGDFALAEVEAEHMPPGADRARLMAGIDQARGELAGKLRQRRRAIAACAALLAALAGGGVLYARQQHRAAVAIAEANERLAAQHARATKAREDAEGLLTFMLGDLRGRLEPVGLLPVLDTVGDKALRYFAALPPGEAGPASQASRALALRQVGEVQLKQGRLEDAASSFAKALEATAALRRESPGNPDWRFAEAEAEIGAGMVEHARGDVEGAGARFLRAEALLDGAPPRLALRAQESLGAIAMEKGDLKASLERYTRAIALAEAVAAASDAPADAVLLAGAHSDAGYALRLMGRMDEAEARFERSVSLMGRAAESEPGNALWWRAYAAELDRLAGVQIALGKRAAALRNYGAGLETMERLSDRDPSNAEWLGALAIALMRVGQIKHEDGDPAAALATFRRVGAKCRAMLERDSSNSQALMHLAWSLGTAGKAQHDLGDEAGAVESLAEALEIRDRMLATDPANAWWMSDAAGAKLAMARQLAQMGMREAAAPLAMEARDAAAALVRRDPGNGYWANLLASCNAAAADAIGGDAAVAFRDEAELLARALAARTGESPHLATLAEALAQQGCAEEAGEIADELARRGYRKGW